MPASHRVTGGVFINALVLLVTMKATAIISRRTSRATSYLVVPGALPHEQHFATRRVSRDTNNNQDPKAAKIYANHAAYQLSGIVPQVPLVELSGRYRDYHAGSRARA